MTYIDKDIYSWGLLSYVDIVLILVVNEFQVLVYVPYMDN
jgi:hypothetical protein